MGTFNDKMTGLADAFRSKFSLTGGLTIDQMTTTVRNADIGDGGGFDFSAATAFTADQLLEGEKGFNSNGELITGTLTISDTPVTPQTASEYGYFTADGNFQQITLDADAPQNVGESVEIAEGSVFLYATGQDEPDYSIITDATAADVAYGKTVVLNGMLVTGAMPTSSISVKDNVVSITSGKIAEREVTVGTALAAKTYTPGTSPIVIKEGQYLTGDQTIEAVQSSGGIEFYECATYTPDADAYIKYTVALSDAPDTDANTTYERKKFVENPDPDNYAVTAKWQAENGYCIEENHGYGEWSYYIKTKDGYTKYAADMLSSRVTDFRTVSWMDWDMYEPVTLTFSEIQSENIPATTEGWTGRKVTQDTETGAWIVAEEITPNLTVTHLKPKVGEIFSADTTIRVDRMYDGAVFPIPQDGLVFYAPLQTDYVDMVSGEAAVVTDGTFIEHNGIRCLELDGSGYVTWASNDDLPTGSSPLSFVILAAPTSQGDWRTYLCVGNPDGGFDINAKNGHLKEWGGDYITATGLWQSLIVTRDDSGAGKAYLNGKLNGTGTNATANIPASSSVFVGANTNGHTNASGYVAFAAVYNRELTADEVAEIHAALMDGVQQ